MFLGLYSLYKGLGFRGGKHTSKAPAVHDCVEGLGGNAHHQGLPGPHGADLIIPAGRSKGLGLGLGLGLRVLGKG